MIPKEVRDTIAKMTWTDNSSMQLLVVAEKISVQYGYTFEESCQMVDDFISMRP